MTLIRWLTIIGVLIAIALPLLDLAFVRPGRRPIATARMMRVERLIFVTFFLAVILQALSSFGMILTGQPMHGWMLILHMSVAGLFAVTLTALALLWAEQSTFGRPPHDERFFAGEKIAFWLTVASGLVTILSAMLGMMTWFGTIGQLALLNVHRYAALVLLICAVFQGYRLLMGRPSYKTESVSTAR